MNNRLGEAPCPNLLVLSAQFTVYLVFLPPVGITRWGVMRLIIPATVTFVP
jgi:hypothetical protein